MLRELQHNFGTGRVADDDMVGWQSCRRGLEGDQSEVEVPSNRRIVFALRIAREVAVSEKSSPKSKVQSFQRRKASTSPRRNQRSRSCPRDAARVVSGVKLRHPGVVQRVARIGQRPINKVADITN